MNDHKEEDIILPETEGVIHEDTPPSSAPKPHKPHNKIKISFPVIIAIVGFLALAAALIIVIVGKSPAPEPTPTETEETYYNRDEFNAAMNSADQHAMEGDYIGAKAYLDTYNKTELMTNAQRYRFCQIMVLIYSEAGYNNPDLVAEYTRLGDEAFQNMQRGKE